MGTGVPDPVDAFEEVKLGLTSDPSRARTCTTPLGPRFTSRRDRRTWPSSSRNSPDSHRGFRNNPPSVCGLSSPRFVTRAQTSVNTRGAPAARPNEEPYAFIRPATLYFLPFQHHFHQYRRTRKPACYAEDAERVVCPDCGRRGPVSYGDAPPGRARPLSSCVGAAQPIVI